MPRPTKCTPKLRKALAAKVRETGLLEYSADSLRVPRSTVYRWLRQGAAGEKPYCELWQDISAARADKLYELQTRVESTAEGAKWLMGKITNRFNDKSNEVLVQQLLDTILPHASDSFRGELFSILNKLKGIDTPLLGGGE